VRKEELDIRSSDIVTWLRSEIQARQLREGNNNTAGGLRQPRQASQQNPLESDQDVQILVPQHRSKKTNRRNIIESGMSIPRLCVILQDR
jgi:translation initiation factor 2-alpha kinase 4